MHPELLKQSVVSTPAFVIDRRQILANLASLTAVRRETGCRLLYSIKALPLTAVLQWLKPVVDGFSVSSLFEAKLADEVLQGGGELHLTTPGLRDHEFAELSALCGHISFNSLSQFQRFCASGHPVKTSMGLRINTKRSFVDDDRYNPCRLHSKLGVDIDSLAARLPEGVEGLQFHTVFGRTDFAPLISNIAALRPILANNPQLKWLNVGGGYLYHAIDDCRPLVDVMNSIKRDHSLDIYLEPGKAVVGNAGYLVTTIIDRFVSDGRTVLVLDTSVNHHPEVFEYQRKPTLIDARQDGGDGALLVGSTCLAGDLFGDYCFATLPKVGDRLVFRDVGAYSLAKAYRFNGYDLPTIYSIEDDRVMLVKHYGYDAYRVQWVGEG